MPPGKNWLVLCLCSSTCLPLVGQPAETLSAGPLAHEFSLTLSPGSRTEALGPLLSCQETEGVEEWTFGPLLSHSLDAATDSESLDFAYPVLTYHRYGAEYRVQVLQLLSFSGGRSQRDHTRSQVNVFPFYFQQRSTDPSQNYTALVPLCGSLKNRFFRDEIRFVLFPAYVQTRKKDVVTDNYLLPFLDVRRGDALKGWQFWPLVGHEHKGTTLTTNGFNEVETVGGHDNSFALWPLFFHQQTGLGTDRPEEFRALLPLYSHQHAPQRESSTCLWPLFTFTDDRDKKYRERDLPWPLVVFARGEGKTANRVWPFFSRAHNADRESDFYLWPIYKCNRLHSTPLDRQRTRILFFLYSDLIEKNTTTGTALHRTDLWPMFTARRDHDGNERLQVLALLEPFLPTSKAIARNYSPLWSLWRSEKNARTGAASQSLLWNLYRRETGPTTKKCSLLFGLFQYQSDLEGRCWRLLFVPVAHAGKVRPSQPGTRK